MRNILLVGIVLGLVLVTPSNAEESPGWGAKIVRSAPSLDVPASVQRDQARDVVKAKVVLENGEVLSFVMLEGRPAVFQYRGGTYEITPRALRDDPKGVAFEIAEVHYGRSAVGDSVEFRPSVLARPFSVHFEGFGTEEEAKIIAAAKICCKTCGGVTACNECVALPCGSCGCDQQ